MKRRIRPEANCSSKTRVTASLLLAFLALPSAQSLQPIEPWVPIPTPPDTVHDFTLRHIFHRGTYQDPNLHVRIDVPAEQPLWTLADNAPPRLAPFPHISARSHAKPIQRLKDRHPNRIEEHLAHARTSGQPAALDVSHWTVDEVMAPNITDKETIINLAVMAANAYVEKPDGYEWENVTQGFNESRSFGWEGDGLRGHIFGDKNNETIIVSLKGTSPAVFDGDGTTTRDKLNDNLFFSCCCAQGGQYFWRQVCDCYTSTYTCNQTCLVQSLKKENRYYRAAIDLYTNVTELYPTSNVWLVGHSLGGAVSSLLGTTFGLPVVTFEAPGDDLAAKRLGLPAPPSHDPNSKYRQKYSGSVHIGHTADPIFMGTCNGATAACTLGGYAMESQCHTGLRCVYDTVGDNGWRVGIGYHKIHNVIDNVIRKYKAVPRCVPDDECFDCFNWKYFKSNGSDSKSSTTTTSSTTIRTRTSTCKTPGWWGCLDESTTTTTTPVVTTTYTTTSCATPGWFGCNKEVNVTITTTTVAATTTKTTSVPATTTPEHTSPSPSSRPSSSSPTSTTCHHEGWFGCRDPPFSSFPTTSTSHHSSSSSHAHPHTSCETPGFFWGCYDEPHDTHTTATPTMITTTPRKTASPIETRTITVPPTASSTSSTAPSTTATTSDGKGRKRKCKHPAFFGLICLDSPKDKADAQAMPTPGPNVDGEEEGELVSEL